MTTQPVDGTEKGQQKAIWHPISAYYNYKITLEAEDKDPEWQDQDHSEEEIVLLVWKISINTILSLVKFGLEKESFLNSQSIGEHVMEFLLYFISLN